MPRHAQQGKQTMWRRYATQGAVAALLSLSVLSSGIQSDAPPATSTTGAVEAPADPPSGVYFVENKGQAPSHVRYLVMGAGHDAWITDRGLAVLLTDAAVPAAPSPRSVLADLEDAAPPVDVNRSTHLLLLNATGTAASVLGGEPTGAVSNYYIGADPSAWTTGARNYESVLQRDVWPGIDVKWYGDPGLGLKFDVIVSPGADAGAVAFTADGALIPAVGARGELRLSTPLGDVLQERPFTYQLVGTERVEVESAYNVTNAEIRYDLGSYDEDRALVIDPAVTLTSSSYLGGSSDDTNKALAVDGSGNAIVVGYTRSTNYPTKNAAQPVLWGQDDVVVTKVDPSGALVYSTYLGGQSSDYGEDVAVDSSGSAYVTGNTFSSDFPVQNPYQASKNSNRDIIVFKLSSAGSLSYSTFLGGSGYDWGMGIAVDSSRNIYVAGYTTSTDYPTKNAIRASYAGGNRDAVVTKISSSLTSLSYSTYLGGGLTDVANAIAADGSGYAYITGYTSSSNFPETESTSHQGGTYDVFLTRLTSTGNLYYSRFYGGSGWEFAEAIAVDGFGYAYATGLTNSANLQMVDATQPSIAGSDDAFVVKVNQFGTLAFSTYLGGSSTDSGWDIALDGSRNAYVLGDTYSTNFPTQNALQGLKAGENDVSITVYSSSNSITSSTYFGGSDYEWARGIGVDSSGNVWFSGDTQSTNYPLLNAFQGSKAGGVDMFVTRIGAESTPPTVSGAPQSWSWQRTIPTVFGVTWRDTGSGLDNDARYSVGTSSGGTNVRSWGTMPTQPSEGQTSSWNPSWKPGSLAQGRNYVNVLVSDMEDNTLTSTGAYVIDYDSVGDSTPNLVARSSSGGSLLSGSWQTDNTPYFDWSPASSTSPIQGYRYSLSTSSSSSPGTGGVHTTATAYDRSNSPLSDGLWYFKVRAKDTAGNYGSINTEEVRIDRSAPTATGAGTIIYRSSETALSGACFQDPHSGLTATTTYWIGSSPGASDLLAETSTPVQPAQGQSSSWCPSFTPPDVWQSGTSYVTVRVEDVLGHASTVQAYEVRFDGTPPVSTLTVTGTEEASGWYSSIQDLHVSATDDASGVGSITWTWSGATTTSGTGSSPALPEPGTSTLTYYAADAAQPPNVEDPQTRQIQFDPTPPLLSLSPAPGVELTAWNRGTGTDPALEVTVHDPHSGVVLVEASMDGGMTWSTEFSSSTGRTEPVSYALLFDEIPDGTTPWVLRAVDANGHESTVDAVLQWDRLAPTSSASLQGTVGENGWHTSLDPISIQATDEHSGVTSTPWTWSGDSAGSGTTADAGLPSPGASQLDYHAVDAAGNQGAPHALTVQYDPIAPGVAVTPAAGVELGAWNHGTEGAVATVTAVDSESGVALVRDSLDGGTTWNTHYASTPTASTTYDLQAGRIPEGTTTWIMEATDQSGHVTTTSQTLRWDNTDPTASLSVTGSPGANGWYQALDSISITADDEPSGVESTPWTWTGDATGTGTSPVVTLPAPGDSLLSYGAVDVAGNQAATQLERFLFDPDEPLITVTPGADVDFGAWNSGTSKTAASVTVADAASGITLVRDSLDGGQSWRTVYEPATPAESFAFDLQAAEVPEGTTTWIVEATDHSGHVASASTSLSWDNTPPASTLSVTGTAGSNGWLTSLDAPTISATDNLAGVKATPWTWSGDSSSTGISATVTLPSSGRSTLTYHAVDNAKPSNVESPKQQVLSYDPSPPVLDLAVQDPAAAASWSSHSGAEAALTWSSSDAHSGLLHITSSLNGATTDLLPASPVESGQKGILSQQGAWSLDEIPEGTTTVDIESTNAAGLTSTASTVLRYDRTPPLLAPEEPWIRSDFQAGWPHRVSVRLTNPIAAADGTMSSLDAASETSQWRQDHETTPRSLDIDQDGDQRVSGIFSSLSLPSSSALDPTDDYFYWRFTAADMATPANVADTGWIEYELPTHHDPTAGALEPDYARYRDYPIDSSDEAAWMLRETRIDTTTNSDPCSDASDPPETVDGLVGDCQADESVAIRLEMYPRDFFHPGQDLSVDVSVNAVGSGLNAARDYEVTLTVTCYLITAYDDIFLDSSTCATGTGSHTASAGNGAGARTWGPATSITVVPAERIYSIHYTSHVVVQACVADPGVTGGQACASNVLAAYPYQTHTMVSGDLEPGSTIYVTGFYTRITTLSNHKFYCTVEIEPRVFSKDCSLLSRQFSTSVNSVRYAVRLPETLLGNGRGHFGTAYTDPEHGLVVAAGDGNSNVKATATVNPVELLAEAWSRDDQPDLAERLVFPDVQPLQGLAESHNVLRLTNTGGSTLHVTATDAVGPGGGADAGNVAASVEACLYDALTSTPSCQSLAESSTEFVITGDAVRYLALRVQTVGAGNGVQRDGTYVGRVGVSLS